jgi:hypothetical protein
MVTIVKMYPPFFVQMNLKNLNKKKLLNRCLSLSMSSLLINNLAT